MSATTVPAKPFSINDSPIPRIRRSRVTFSSNRAASAGEVGVSGVEVAIEKNLKLRLEIHGTSVYHPSQAVHACTSGGGSLSTPQRGARRHLPPSQQESRAERWP